MISRNFIRFLLLYLCFVSRVAAHQVDFIEMKFLQEDGKWKLVGQLDVGYMLTEVRRIVEAPPVLRDEVMNGTKEFHEKIIREAEDTMRWLIVFRYNGQELPWKIRFPDFEKQPLNLPIEPSGWAVIRAEIYTDSRPGPGELTVSWYDEFKADLIIVHPKAPGSDSPSAFPIAPKKTGTLLKVGAPEGTVVHATTPTSQQAENWIISGFRHVIPLGLDHLLFIFGLFLLAPRWKALLGQSLLFTLAHSITLALSIFGVIALPSKWIELLIAASIAWIGIENLLLRDLKPSRLYLVFGFGLLHGMGFASVLREKITELSGSQLAIPLIGFNFGVELAQITVLALAFLLLWPLRKWTRTFQTVGSIIVALAGLFWFFDRL
jgi:hydrogenase/urease accessory protein HupE